MSEHSPDIEIGRIMQGIIRESTNLSWAFVSEGGVCVKCA
jgi:hypothetical protein